MERQNPRSSTKLSTGAESKGKQDVTNKHLRMPRLKESVSPRPEARRKQNPQRNRELFDKRPRNRTRAVCEGYRSEITEDLEETFSRHGSKKINLNHLLNFTLTPVENRDAGIKRPNFNRNKHPKYNKELFLQANCQFIARNSGNYSVHEKNPDILVEWTLIEEICLPSYEVPLCPICLYSPVAAKITRCGHIYCWPCILHYLALTDKTWQKCPICFEAVHKNELKSVFLKIQKAFTVGDKITMCLMKRAKGSLLTAPVVHESPKQLCNLEDDDNVVRFQKLLLASEKDVDKIISRERKELDKAYAEEKHTPEACFIESALKLVEERANNTCLQFPQESAEAKQMFQDNKLNNNTYQQKHLESVSSTDSQENFASEVDQNLHQAEDTVACSSNLSSQACSLESGKNEFSYFYQAEDGQHIYLHHLNVRMLVKEYGSLENAPPVITANIVEIESVSMTEILRKRLRYLQHLPLTCEFQVVELNFSNLLMKSTLLQFQTDINKRKHLRNRKAQYEKHREKIIEVEENKKLGKFPEATYNLNSIAQFPSCDLNMSHTPPKHSYISENSYFGSCTPDPQLEGTCPIETSSLSSLPDDGNPFTSFAQKLKEGQKSFNHVPKPKKVNEDEKHKYDVPSEDESWMPPPVYNQSFSDAIQAALETVSLQETPGNGKKSGKKKKGKKQLLFTTSMCRNK